jgi:predicted XRE-type DNA-binding protein
MLEASANTTFALDAMRRCFHVSDMENASEIRAALKAKLDAREITQKEIGTALGIQQPNVATLFSPGKNGKLRGIDFDEGMKLIKRFRLDDADGQRSSVLNEALLGRLIHALAPSFPSSEVSESAAQALAVALTHALELLQETGATEPTDREVAMAARAATSRYLEASRQ